MGFGGEGGGGVAEGVAGGGSIIGSWGGGGGVACDGVNHTTKRGYVLITRQQLTKKPGRGYEDLPSEIF